MARRRMMLCAGCVLLLSALAVLLYYILAATDPTGDDLRFVSAGGMLALRAELDKERIKRPKALLHGGGGEGTPADRETRYRAYDPTRETRQ